MSEHLDSQLNALAQQIAHAQRGHVAFQQEITRLDLAAAELLNELTQDLIEDPDHSQKPTSTTDTP